jgi:hypothetical protein
VAGVVVATGGTVEAHGSVVVVGAVEWGARSQPGSSWGQITGERPGHVEQQVDIGQRIHRDAAQIAEPSHGQIGYDLTDVAHVDVDATGGLVAAGYAVTNPGRSHSSR